MAWHGMGWDVHDASPAVFWDRCLCLAKRTSQWPGEGVGRGGVACGAWRGAWTFTATRYALRGPARAQPVHSDSNSAGVRTKDKLGSSSSSSSSSSNPIPSARRRARSQEAVRKRGIAWRRHRVSTSSCNDHSRKPHPLRTLRMGMGRFKLTVSLAIC